MLEGKKISELETVDSLSLGCCFPILSKGATKRITFSTLLNEIENELPESDINEVKAEVEQLKEKTKSIDTLNTEMEAVKDQVSGVDEMVAGQNATIRNCVSTVEGLEQTIEQTHFDDVLALEEQVRANTTNVEKKLNKTTSTSNAGKAVVVDEDGNLVFGAAGVQVSEAEGNAIEEKEDGIYVAPLPEGLSGLPIGASILWASENIPAGFLKYDGTIYNKSDYPVLFTRIPNEWKIDENTFKLPDVKDRVAQGANGNLGELVEAGLPNIIGDLSKSDNNFPLSSGNGWKTTDTGALEGYSSSVKNAFSGTSSTANRVFGFTFDASKGETKADGTLKAADELHVYGNSDTVQMAAVALYYIIKATDYTTVQEDVIDDTKFTTGNVLSAAKTKAEIDAKHSYSTEEIVVGTWIDGKPIYRKCYIGSVSTSSDILLENCVDKIAISVKGFAKIADGNTLCLGYSGTHNLNIYVKNNELYLTGGYSIREYRIIFEYTKTTD